MADILWIFAEVGSVKKLGVVDEVWYIDAMSREMRMGSS